MSIFTLDEPFEIIPGPAGTQGGNMQGLDMSVRRAAGLFSILVVSGISLLFGSLTRSTPAS